MAAVGELVSAGAGRSAVLDALDSTFGEIVSLSSLRGGAFSLASVWLLGNGSAATRPDWFGSHLYIQ